MNLNENPRLENIEISESREFAEYFQAVSDAVFLEVPPGVNRSAMLDLSDIPDDHRFTPIQANPILRSTTNEPTSTHTLKQS